MAKGGKQSNTVDIKMLHSKMASERESLIKYGEDQNFAIRFMNGVFIVKDKLSNNTVAILPHITLEPKDYGNYVRAYIGKVRR